MKKIVTITVIVILILNFISIKSFALEYDKPMDLTGQETGTTAVENDNGESMQAQITGQTYTSPVTYKAVSSAISLIPRFANQLMESFVEVTTDDDVKVFTIYKTVMGHYDVFNINYMDTVDEKSDDLTLAERIKVGVFKYYKVLRNLSIALSLFILVYIGIRMAISTVASDRAKYNKMLIGWVASLVLVFIMHFIVVFISYILQEGLVIVNSIAKTWGVREFETQIYKGAIQKFAGGFHGFSSFVIIHVLVWYQIKFFIYYLRRTLEVNFLILISPIVTITYPIDKAGDGKAQAFQAFLKELILKSSMQLLHAITYVVFIATAGVVASNQPLLAVVFFAALSRTEKIVRKIFALKDDGLEKASVPLLDFKLPFIQ